MNMMKKLLPVLLCMIMVVTMFAVTASAAGGSANVSLTVSATAPLDPGDTFTVTIKSGEMSVTSFACGIKFDTNLLEVTAINSPTLRYDTYDEDEGEDVEMRLEPTAISTVTEANGNGTVGAAWANATERSYKSRTTLIKVTFTAKAAGTATITLFEDSSGTDGYKNESVATETVTIASSTPVCEHTNTKAVPNNDGTHNIVCADETCGEPIETNVACSGGTATCTEKAVCSACNTAYGDFGAHTSAEVTYTNNGDTHSATYDCCGGVYVTNESHTYVDHFCVCGATFTGWEGDIYYEDAVMQTGWTQVDDAWYYFDTTTGTRTEGLSRMEYPTVGGFTYAPNAEAIAYCESNGISFVDATTALFLFDENGVFQSDFTGLLDGHYYVNGMQTWHPGLIQIGEDYYYFTGDMVEGGNKLVAGDVYVTEANGIDGFVEGAIYNFKDGKLSGANGIVDGKYYENSRLMIGNGLTKLGENYIYVRSNGEVVMNRNYWVSENELGIAAGEYFFDENGFLVMPEEGFTGIQNIGDVLYYYEDGHKAYGAGLIELEDGSVVYVRSNGALAIGDYYVTNLSNYDGTDIQLGDKVTFGEDGKMLEDKNGIIDGVYYVDNHVAYAAGLIEYNNGYIYVRSNGQVATGKYWITNVNETGFVEGYYEFDENGMMIAE